MELSERIAISENEVDKAKLVDLRLLDIAKRSIAIFGTNYVLVSGKGTPTENAAELQAAFNATKLLNRLVGNYTIGAEDIFGFDFKIGDVVTMYDENEDEQYYYQATSIITDCQEEPYEGAANWNFLPNGYTPTLSLSATNRFTIIVAPGTYTFGSVFLVDQKYVDIVSLTGAIDVVLNGINITSNDNKIKGINCVSRRFQIASGLNLLVVEDCIALAQYSFQVSGTSTVNLGNTVSGTFINCKVGRYAFAYKETANGLFENCNAIVGADSFAQGGTASGIFINCHSVYDGMFGLLASGTFKNCSAGGGSFGGNTGGNASGNFYDCTGTGYHCFGDIASGNFYKCKGVQGNFAGGFLATLTFTGKAFHCVSGEGSFGKTALTGKLHFCKIEDLAVAPTLPKTFTAVTGTGKTRYCIDGTDTINNQG